MRGCAKWCNERKNSNKYNAHLPYSLTQRADFDIRTVDHVLDLWRDLGLVDQVVKKRQLCFDDTVGLSAVFLGIVVGEVVLVLEASGEHLCGVV